MGDDQWDQDWEQDWEDDYSKDDTQYKEDECEWEACYDETQGEAECWVEQCMGPRGEYECTVYYVDERGEWQEIACEEGMAYEQKERIEKLSRAIEGFNESLSMTADMLCPEGKCISEPLMQAEMDHNLTGKVDDLFAS